MLRPHRAAGRAEAVAERQPRTPRTPRPWPGRAPRGCDKSPARRCRSSSEATVSLASSMNSSIRRCASLRSDAVIASICPSSSSRISASGRSKSIEPRRRRRSRSNSKRSCMSRSIATIAGSAMGCGCPTARQHGVDGRVGQPGAASNDAVVKRATHGFAARIQVDDARLHEPVDSRVEAAQIRGQLRREHVHRAIGKVHRGAAFARIVVEGAAGLHVVRHVGDVHAQRVAAPAAPRDRHRVVEIPGVVAVDGHRQGVAEVRPPLAVLRAHVRAHPAGLGHRRGAVGLGDPVPAQDDGGVHAGRIGLAHHVDDAADRPSRRGRPARDLDLHHVARRGVRVPPLEAPSRDRASGGRTAPRARGPPASVSTCPTSRADPRSTTRTMRPSRRRSPRGDTCRDGDAVAVDRLVKLGSRDVVVAGLRRRVPG